MQQQLDLGALPKATKAGNFSPEELLQKNTILEAELLRVLRELYEIRNLKITDSQLKLLMQEQLESLRDAEFGASSERYKKTCKEARRNQNSAKAARKEAQ